MTKAPRATTTFQLRFKKKGSGLGKKKIIFYIVSGYIIFVPIIFSLFLPIIWLPCLLILEFQFPLMHILKSYYVYTSDLLLNFVQRVSHLLMPMTTSSVMHFRVTQYFLPLSLAILAYEGSSFRLRWLGTLQIFQSSGDLLTLWRKESAVIIIIYKGRCWYTYIVSGLGAA